MIKIRKYKIWVVLLRVIAFAIPASLMLLGEQAEKLCDWLHANLPNPKK